MNVLDIARHNPGWLAERRNGQWRITRLTKGWPALQLRFHDEGVDGWHTWQVLTLGGRAVAGGRGPAAEAFRAVNSHDPAGAA